MDGVMLIHAGTVAQQPKGVLLLSGTVGSGKTTIATEVGDQLAAKGVRCAVVDGDWLGWVHVGDGFHAYDRLIFQNLLAMWPNFRTVGVEYLVLARALLHREPVDQFISAFPQSRITVVRLRATRSTVEARLIRRDSGETLQEHLREAEVMDAELDRVRLEDATVINDDRSIAHVARQVLTVIGWEPFT